MTDSYNDTLYQANYTLYQAPEYVPVRAERWIESIWIDSVILTSILFFLMI
jgi:hypothetical protein